MNKEPSATKSGPGRRHKQGHSKSSPIKSRGARLGFVLHTASAAKRDRKLLIALHGRRQWLRMEKEFRAEHKAANDERTDGASSRHYEQPELA